MVPVCDKRYHIYNRFRHFWAEIMKLWNYPLQRFIDKTAFFYYPDLHVLFFYTKQRMTLY